MRTAHFVCKCCIRTLPSLLRAIDQSAKQMEHKMRCNVNFIHSFKQYVCYAEVTLLFHVAIVIFGGINQVLEFELMAYRGFNFVKLFITQNTPIEKRNYSK